MKSSKISFIELRSLRDSWTGLVGRWLPMCVLCVCACACVCVLHACVFVYYLTFAVVCKSPNVYVLYILTYCITKDAYLKHCIKSANVQEVSIDLPIPIPYYLWHYIHRWLYV